MDTLWQDVRQARRTLARARGFVLLAVLTLAIGIGAVSAIYSVVDAILVRPLPFADAARLVVLDGTYTPSPASAPKLALDVTDWQAMHGTFDTAAVIMAGAVNLSADVRAMRIDAARTTPNLFRVLGVQPARGRGFTSDEGEPGHAGTVIVSDGLWHRQFGGAPDIIGRTVTLDERQFVIVGVMPQGFGFPGNTDVWLPLVLRSERAAPPLFLGRMTVLARLAPGITLARARAAVDHAERAFSHAHGTPSKFGGVQVLDLRTTLVGNVRAKLRILIGASALMLLLACANVAGLLLARAEARQHEVAVRAAIGATPTRLVRQLAVEGGLLALAGTIGGLLLAWALRPLLVSLVPEGLAGLAPIGLNARVLGCTLAAAIVSTLVFCLTPALVLARADVHLILKASGARGATRVGRLWQRLLVGQIGVTVVVLVAAGLLLESLWRLEHADPGFAREGVLTVNVALPSATYPTRARRAAYYRDVVARLEGLPGVTAAGVVNSLPLERRTWEFAYTAMGRAPLPEGAEPPMAEYLVASPGYFSAMRVPVVAGRAITGADVASRRAVMLVDEVFARQFGAVHDAIGQRIRMPWDSTYEIVGVVRTVRDGSLDGTKEPAGGQLYLPAYADPASAMTVVVRGPVESQRFVENVGVAIRGVDPSVPPYAIRTMEQVVSQSIAPIRTTTLLVALAAAIGLALALVGVFGLMAASVARRTREIGIRVALGASGGRICRLVFEDALLMAISGTALGLLGAWAASKLIAHVLYAVQSSDPVIYLVVPLCVAVTTIVATLVPVYRAMRVDPTTALRSE